MVVNDIARHGYARVELMGGWLQQSVFVYHFDILSLHLEYTIDDCIKGWDWERGTRLTSRLRLVALGCRPILVRPEVQLAAEGTWRPAWA